MVVVDCAAGRTLAVALAIGVATLLAHSLELGLAFLLHCALYATLLHMRIGRNLRLNGVPLNHLSEREGYHKESHYGDAYDDDNKYSRHLVQFFWLFLVQIYYICVILHPTLHIFLRREFHCRWRWLGEKESE